MPEGKLSPFDTGRIAPTAESGEATDGLGDEIRPLPAKDFFPPGSCGLALIHERKGIHHSTTLLIDGPIHKKDQRLWPKEQTWTTGVARSASRRSGGER